MSRTVMASRRDVTLTLVEDLRTAGPRYHLNVARRKRPFIFYEEAAAQAAYDREIASLDDQKRER